MRFLEHWRGDDRFRTARRWSNSELRRFGALFRGDAVNVSAADDKDKEGGHYRDYFPNCSSYTITNFSGHKGHRGREAELLLDLSAPLESTLVKQFDVVFNHTTLEHVLEVGQAFRTLCELSRDVVIIVVPFSQAQHGSPMGDFWRFAPQAITGLFEANDFTCLYVSASPQRNAAIYLFAIGVRHPSRWNGSVPQQVAHDVGAWIGSPHLGGPLVSRLRRVRRAAP